MHEHIWRPRGQVYLTTTHKAEKREKEKETERTAIKAATEIPWTKSTRSRSYTKEKSLPSKKNKQKIVFVKESKEWLSPLQVFL
jgi:hypothetical protein